MSLLSRFGDLIRLSGYDGALSSKDKPLTEDGKELLDPTPMAPPIGYRRQPSLAEQIREAVRSEALRQALEEGVETFEEADDFNVGDDFDPRTPYETEFDVPVSELQRRAAAEAAEADPEAEATPPAPKDFKAPKGRARPENAPPSEGAPRKRGAEQVPPPKQLDLEGE